MRNASSRVCTTQPAQAGSKLAGSRLRMNSKDAHRRILAADPFQIAGTEVRGESC
jgi:hypothetical protein